MCGVLVRGTWVFALLIGSCLASAADIPNDLPSNQSSASDLQEITVTARKRQESLVDTPVVETVVTSATLQEYQIEDLQDVASHIPSLLLGAPPGSPGVQITLRGIGATALNPTTDNSVLLSVDGLSLSQGNAYDVAMFDLKQLEVLKGPQPLYFGKDSTAGVVSVQSNDPTDAVEVIARGGYEGVAKEKLGEFILSGPVTDTLKLRLAARYDYQDGYFINYAQGDPSLGGETPAFRNYAPTQEYMVRGTVLWTPDDAFTARLKLNYNNYMENGGATPQQIDYCPAGLGPVPPVNISFNQGNCTIGRDYYLAWFNPAAFPGILHNGEPFNDYHQDFGSLELNYRPSSQLTLTSVTGYYDLNFFDQNLGSATATTTPVAAEIGFDDREFTQELRLLSDHLGPVNFMVGGFYQNGKQSDNLFLPGNTFLGLPGLLQSVVNVVDIHSASLFGQVLWDINKEWELDAGARWTDEKRSHQEYNFNPAQGPLGSVPLIEPQIKSDTVSPEVTLLYKPSDTLRAFASYKQGVKSGSFSTANFQPSTTNSSFGDEKAKGGEIGVKTDTADHRVQGTVAVYYYKYTDLQVGANELSAIGGGNFVTIVQTLNAASAIVKGIEFDGKWAPAALDGLTFDASLGYNHARYQSFPNAPCGNDQTISQGCNQLFNPTTGIYNAQNLAGNNLVKAPDWSGYVGAQYKMPLTSNLGLGFGADTSFSSRYSTNLTDQPGFYQGGFAKVDANVALSPNDDRWQLALIVRNITDRYTADVCTNSNLRNGAVFGGQVSGAAVGGPAGGDMAACAIETGRQIWGRITYRFK